MKDLVQTIPEKCVGCNRCVRECPMELANVTYQNEEGSIKVKVDDSKCIACARCVIACRHDARQYEDDTERFFRDLAAGLPISLIAAPSISSNIPRFKRLFTYLRNLGVKKIYDVSLGADICIWAHIRYMEKNSRAHVITQPCPAIVSYCEIYRHDLLKNLSPVQSPMACIAIYMKKYEKISGAIAALSPCIAKSNEFEATKLAQYNVTYSRLIDYLEKNKIALPEEETGFDNYDSGPGSLFPIPGGLKENIEFYMGNSIHVFKSEGFSVYAKLNTYAATKEKLLPGIFDVLNCIEGCNVGPAALQDRSIFEIDWTMKNSRKGAVKNRKKDYFDSLYKSYDENFRLSDFMRDYKSVEILYPEVTDEGINDAYKQLGKDTREKQTIDCHACGNESCYHMARKIALEVNIPINCIVNAMETAKEEHRHMVISEQANKAKSDFLSSMSHEMRTPMNAIIGMAQIASKTEEVDKLKYCLSNIENSSTHLLGIINDVLDISKIEAGKLELDSASMNIEKILIRVCNLITEKIDQKNIAFNIVLGTNMRMHYIGDELRLSQVITNLLSNAVKFTPVGGRIELKADEIKKLKDEYSVIRISVKDSGIGMTEEQRARLFTAYQQGEIGTARKFGGTGLGLAISKSIVEMMNGKIWVDSEPGKGSEFIFEVRLKRQQHKDKATIYGNIKPSDIKVLIADPDAKAREYIKTIIASFGIKSADEAENIRETVNSEITARESGKPYDVIYIDHVLTNKENIEFIENSRFNDNMSNIVIITPFIKWDKIETLLHDTGIHRFIAKPIFPSSILNSINEVISGASRKLDIKADVKTRAPDFSKINLLLADDVEINREIFIALLEDTKVHIETAENGLIAVQKFRENQDKYDIIIMDVQMPEMDGMEASKTIRALGTEKAKNIPIIAMTANVFKEDIDACIKSGMNDHLAKPIELNAVKKKIIHYCSEKL